MSFDPTPWFIGGGAHHSPDVARLLAYAAAGGREGIVGPADLKVSALSSPGASVEIAPGAAMILNRSAGGNQQAYVTRAPTTTGVAIAPTGASPRSDLVVIRVEDPQFSPWQVPNDPVAMPYVFARVIQGVPGDTTDAASLNLGYSAIAVARVDIPANTAAISSGMVKDVRKLAQPRSHREVFTGSVAAGTSLTSSAFVEFPPFKPQLVVPTWATHAIIMAHVSSIGVVGGSTTGGWRAQLGGLVGTEQPFNFDHSGDYRTSELVIADGSVAAMQGRTQTLVMTGRRNSGPGALKTVVGTRVTYDIHFQERTV